MSSVVGHQLRAAASIGKETSTKVPLKSYYTRSSRASFPKCLKMLNTACDSTMVPRGPRCFACLDFAMSPKGPASQCKGAVDSSNLLELCS
jgi:hypothetical protein